MAPSERDAAFLWDILDAARTIREYVQGTTLDDYLRNRKLRLAIERLVEIVGQAAYGTSDELRAQYPQIPWIGMIAQRNVLAHEYGEIKNDRIWIVATERIPELITIIEPLVPPADRD